MTIRVDEARHSGLWKITHQYELDIASHLSSGIRAGDQTRKRAPVSHAITTVGPDTTHHSGVPAGEH